MSIKRIIAGCFFLGVFQASQSLFRRRLHFGYRYDNQHDSNNDAPVVSQEYENTTLSSNVTLQKVNKAVTKQDLVQRLRDRAPIFVAGLPKTGTSSLHKYFSSLHGLWSSHTYGKNHKKKVVRVGRCMENNLKNKRPMLQDCGGYHVWSDQGYADGKKCFYALWQALEDFYQDYLNATIVLNVRNSTDWAKSIRKWNKGSLAARWQKCQSRPRMPTTNALQEWIDFSETYNERIRTFCKQHPSLTCTEFRTEDPKAGQILEREFGISASEWGDCKPSRFRKCKSVNDDTSITEPVTS